MSDQMKTTYASSEDAIAALTPEQYRVTQQSGTEAPFDNEFCDATDAGLYLDVVSGEPSSHRP